MQRLAFKRNQKLIRNFSVAITAIALAAAFHFGI
jgi:hypothetical protein